MAMPVEAPPAGLRFVTKPGIERWLVKTGTDLDVGNVGKNVINGQRLGAGIVPTTVEELIRIPRSADMTPPTLEFPDFQQVPRKSLSVQPESMPVVPASFGTPRDNAQQAMPTFRTKVPATPVRITGVGFFDKVLGQMGVALFNGIELHPILKIEWL